MDRQPWMKWYTSDARADPRLLMCSLAARGLWFLLIFLMHEANPYGHLVVSGRAPTAKELAILLGASAREIRVLLNELEAAGVFSRDANGTIYSRRMVRDRQKAEEGRNWANKRWAENVNTDHEHRGPNGYPTPTPNTQKPEARNQNPESSSLRSDDGSIPSDEIAQAMADWNGLAQEVGLPIVQRLTGIRNSRLRARLKECGGIEGWRTALNKVRQNTWMHGANDRNWMASLDFLLQESSFTKLMEGAYDRSLKSNSASNSGYSNGFAALFAKARHRDED